jgi:hypothetical protein
MTRCGCSFSGDMVFLWSQMLTIHVLGAFLWAEVCAARAGLGALEGRGNRRRVPRVACRRPGFNTSHEEIGCLPTKRGSIGKTLHDREGCSGVVSPGRKQRPNPLSEYPRRKAAAECPVVTCQAIRQSGNKAVIGIAANKRPVFSPQASPNFCHEVFPSVRSSPLCTPDQLQMVNRVARHGQNGP